MALTLLRVERNLLIIALDLSWLSWLPSDKSLFRSQSLHVVRGANVVYICMVCCSTLIK